MVTDPTAGMSDAQLADYYHAHRHDTDEWDVSEAIAKPARLDVTSRFGSRPMRSLPFATAPIISA